VTGIGGWSIALWLLEGIPGGAGELQRTWDRELSQHPVLVLLVGSDLSMMEALNHHDQPFHGRATEMPLRPLSAGTWSARSPITSHWVSTLGATFSAAQSSRTSAPLMS